MAVEPDLEASPFQVGEPVKAVLEIDPCRHGWWHEPWVARRAAEVEHFLACRMDAWRELDWKQLRQPGSASKHERAGMNSCPVSQRQRRQSPVSTWWLDEGESIVCAKSHGLLHDGLSGTAREQYAAVGLVNAAAIGPKSNCGYRRSRSS